MLFSSNFLVLFCPFTHMYTGAGMFHETRRIVRKPLRPFSGFPPATEAKSKPRAKLNPPSKNAALQ